MKDFFSYDGPLLRILNTAVDYVWLNILTLLLCLPILTAGASLTAMHAVISHLRAGNSGVTKKFFSAFSKSFRKATTLWLIVVLFYACLAAGWVIAGSFDIPALALLKILLLLDALFMAFMTVWIFPLEALYENPVRRTLTSALALVLGFLPRTFMMLLIYTLPLALLLGATYKLFPYFAVCGAVLPAYFSSFLYRRVFKEVEKTGKTDEENLPG